MAIDLAERYPGQSVDGDPNYPFGRAKNVTAPGAGDGTPLEADLVNDIYGFLQALLVGAGISPSGLGTTPDTATTSQYLQSLLALSRNGVVISPAALSTGANSNYSPTNWSNAGFVRLSAATGAELHGMDANCQVKTKVLANIDSSDSIAIINDPGTQAAGNAILTPGAQDFSLEPGQIVTAIYDATSAIWRLISSNQLLTTTTRTVVRFVGAGYQSSSDASANGVGWLHLNAAPTTAVSIGAARAKRFISLDHVLPHESTVTRVRVAIKPSTAHTLTDRMNAQFRSGVFNGPSVASSVVYDDGTTNVQWLDITGLSVTVNKEQSTFGVAVENSATFAADQIFGAEVTFTTNKLYVD